MTDGTLPIGTKLMVGIGDGGIHQMDGMRAGGQTTGHHGVNGMAVFQLVMLFSQSFPLQAV